MKKLVSILIMFVFLLPTNALAEKVVFVTLEKLPPKVYKEKGQLMGTYVDIIREACKRLGLEPEFRLLPWKRAIRDVKTGYADGIFPPIRTEERDKFLHFPSEPMTMKRNIVFARKGSGIKADSLDDLKDKVIGVNDYSYGSEFDSYEGLTKQRYEEVKQLVRVLDVGRIELAVASEEPFNFFVKEAGLVGKFEPIYTISEEASHVAFSKATGEKGKTLAEKFGQTLKQMKAEGAVRQIEDRYFK